MSYWFLYNASDGTIDGRPYQGSATAWTNFPIGYKAVSFDDSDQTAQDAWSRPNEYTIQNDQLVHSNAPTAQQQLDAAKQARLAYLQQQFGASLLNGFTSNADGTSRTYAIDSVAMAKWTGALGNINSGKVTSVNLKDFNGNKVILTGAQFQQMASDGFTFFSNQESHLWGKEDNVNAVLLVNYATTQDAINAVNAVTW